MSIFHDPEIFNSVLEGLPLGFYMVDRDMKVIFWNREAERISGYLAQEVLGRQCREKLLVDMDTENPLACGEACQLRDSIRDGQEKEADVFLLHRAGYRIPVRVRAVPIRNSDNKIIGAAESFQEMRYQKQRDRRSTSAVPSGPVNQTTGLPDMDAMRASLHESCAEFAEHHVPFAVLIAGLDGVPKFQLAHGKEATDSALCVVGRTLNNTLRPEDIVGHWNGNYFLAIVKNCDLSVVKRVAERVRKMERSSELKWWGEELFFTVSLGATCVAHKDTPDELVKRAELALQQSVEEGGDWVSVVPAGTILDFKA